MKRGAAIPRVTSQTITVGALLKKIQRLILEEPKRLDMTRWVTAFQGRNINKYARAAMPACGTVACMAGWGAILLRPNAATPARLNDQAEDVFSELLGVGELGRRTTGSLFSCDWTALDERSEEWYLSDVGTPEHAAVIAKRIDAYMARHPEILTRKIDVASVREALA